MTLTKIIVFQIMKQLLTAVISFFNSYWTAVQTYTQPSKLKFGKQLNYMTKINILDFKIS